MKTITPPERYADAAADAIAALEAIADAEADLNHCEREYRRARGVRSAAALDLQKWAETLRTDPMEDDQDDDL